MARAQATAEQMGGVEAYLKLLHGQGRAVMITASAMHGLDDPHAAMLAEKATLEVAPNEELAGPLFAHHLRAKFLFVAGSGAEIWRLEPK